MVMVREGSLGWLNYTILRSSEPSSRSRRARRERGLAGIRRWRVPGSSDRGFRSRRARQGRGLVGIRRWRVPGREGHKAGLGVRRRRPAANPHAQQC